MQCHCGGEKNAWIKTQRSIPWNSYARQVIKTDLNQAHFLICAAFPNSGLKIDAELNNPNFRIKKSVDDILKWYTEINKNPANLMDAGTAAQLVEHWQNWKDSEEKPRQLSLFEMLDME